jgi:hypothetical protein
VVMPMSRKEHNGAKRRSISPPPSAEINRKVAEGQGPVGAAKAE